MKKKNYSDQSDTDSNSVQKEIFKKGEIYSQEENLEDPVVDLFYDELKDHSPKLRRSFDLLFGSMAYALYLIINPFILAYLKLSGVKSPYLHFTGVGQFGSTIKARIYNIGYYQYTNNEDLTNKTSPYHFLYKTNIFKLPLIINVLKGNISLVGPELLDESFSLNMINKYTDFHKRFAPKPGVFPTACYYHSENSRRDFTNELQQDLIFACKQTLP